MQQITVIGKNADDTAKRAAALANLNLANTEVLEKLSELSALPKAGDMLVKKFGMIKMFVK